MLAGRVTGVKLGGKPCVPGGEVVGGAWVGTRSIGVLPVRADWVASGGVYFLSWRM